MLQKLLNELKKVFSAPSKNVAENLTPEWVEHKFESEVKKQNEKIVNSLAELIFQRNMLEKEISDSMDSLNDIRENINLSVENSEESLAVSYMKKMEIETEKKFVLEENLKQVNSEINSFRDYQDEMEVESYKFSIQFQNLKSKYYLSQAKNIIEDYHSNFRLQKGWMSQLQKNIFKMSAQLESKRLTFNGDEKLRGFKKTKDEKKFKELYLKLHNKAHEKIVNGSSNELIRI